MNKIHGKNNIVRCFLNYALLRKSEEEAMPYCYKLQKMKELLDRDAPRSDVVDVIGQEISIYCFVNHFLHPIIKF